MPISGFISRTLLPAPITLFAMFLVHPIANRMFVLSSLFWVRKHEPGVAYKHEGFVRECIAVSVWVQEAREPLELIPYELVVSGIHTVELENSIPVEVVVTEAALGGEVDVGDCEYSVDRIGDLWVGSWNPESDLAAFVEVLETKKRRA